MMKRIRREKKEYELSYENFLDIGFTELTIVTNYRRGLFNKIAGILSYLSINIKGANINRAIEGDCDCMVYTIQVSTVTGEALSCDKVEDVKRMVEDLYRGEVKVEELGGLLRPKTFRRNVPVPETKVKIDNETSEKFTVVEVSTVDRLGVLYTITKVLLDLGTRLRRAIIATEGNRVIDSFYITDINYKKLEDQRQLERIRERIKEVLQ